MDSSPTFDPKGRWLYFVSRRTFEPAYGRFELDYHFTGTDKIYAASLVDTMGRPTPPLNDEESVAAKDEDKKDDKDKDKDKQDKKDDEVPKMRVDLDGIGQRIAELPIPAGRYGGLTAFEDHIVYAEQKGEIVEDGPPGEIAVHSFTLEDQKDKTVVDGVGPDFSVSNDGKKVRYRKAEQFGIVGVDKENKVGDGKVATQTLMMVVDPKAEWSQMFDEAWRLERDFYYDPKWAASTGRPWATLPRARALRRAPLGHQLHPGRAHRRALDVALLRRRRRLPDVPKAPAGLLGVDWQLAGGRYKFAKIYRARDWNSEVEAPLGVPGVGVHEGDVLLTVNGADVKAPMNVYEAFVGTVGKRTRITVSSSGDALASRAYWVTPIADEVSLRLTDWVTANREKVDKATGGKVAYVYVPNTSTQGIQEFAKQFYPQVEKDGIIVDERFDGGGLIRLLRRAPDAPHLVLLVEPRRQELPHAVDRDRRAEVHADQRICGLGRRLLPVLLPQGAARADHRQAHVGRAGRDWHDLPLVDGGSVTMPDFGFWDVNGKWAVENHGVDPDIEVENYPHLMAKGQDPQLERAIQYQLEQLKAHPASRPKPPPYKVQPGLGGR